MYDVIYNDHSVIAIREVIGIYSENRSNHTKILGFKPLIKEMLKSRTGFQIICPSNVVHRIYDGLYVFHFPNVIQLCQRNLNYINFHEKNTTFRVPIFTQLTKTQDIMWRCIIKNFTQLVP